MKEAEAAEDFANNTARRCSSSAETREAVAQAREAAAEAREAAVKSKEAAADAALRAAVEQQRAWEAQLQVCACNWSRWIAFHAFQSIKHL